jgi:HSP20 family protein
MAESSNRNTNEQRGGTQSNQPAARSQRTGTLTRGEHYDPFWYPSLGGGLLSSPLSMMRRMIDEMDRAWGHPALPSSGGLNSWRPAIEVSERNGNLVVYADLPGLSKEDVHVEATDDAIVIEGERREEHKDEQGGVHRTERSYGHFYRSIPLPEGANAENARATFNNGVLEITMPLPERKSNRRQIPLESGAGSSGGGSAAPSSPATPPMQSSKR